MSSGITVKKIPILDPGKAAYTGGGGTITATDHTNIPSMQPFEPKTQQLNPIVPAASSTQPAGFNLQPLPELPKSPELKTAELKNAKLGDFAAEAAKIYNMYNQGGYKQQLQPTYEYMQSQIPTLTKNFMNKAFGQNISPQSGLGGQISAKLLSDFQTNVLAPVLQQVGTQQALNAPKEQLALAQYLQTGDQSYLDRLYSQQQELLNKQYEQEKTMGERQYDVNIAERDKQIANLQGAVGRGEIDPKQVAPLLSKIYGVDQNLIISPDVRNKVLDEFMQDAYKSGRTPTIEEINQGLSYAGMTPISQEEINKRYGDVLKTPATDVKISSLLSRLNRKEINQDDAARYGVPYVAKNNKWVWEDTPKTRTRIKELYSTNPSFKAWFDFNAV